MALARPCELRLVDGARIFLPRRFPEQADRRPATGHVPHTCRDDSVRAGDTGHLAKPADRVSHEVNDELRERCVELVVVERELLRGRESHVDARVALLRRGHEGLGGIDGSHVVRTEPLNQLRRERSGPAPDVDCSLTRSDSGKVRELRRERHRIPAHEPVVGVSGDDEGHGRIL